MLTLLANTTYILLGVLGACLLVAMIVVIMVIGIYNALVQLRERYKNSFSQIDVQLQRRYDLIPNLVDTAKGYMKHEAQTLEAVVMARNQAVTAAKAASADPGNPSVMASLSGAEGNLAGAMSKLMLVVESYPELKANTNMLQIQEELTSTENKVSFARQAYNDAVTKYNIKRSTFPDMFVASAFNFAAAELFEIKNEGIREAPKVNFA